MKPIQTKKCITCGKLFEKKSNISKKNWKLSKFCSNPCINKGRISRFRGLRPLSEERKRHLSEVLIGRRCNTGRTHFKKGESGSPNTQFNKGRKPWNAGKPNPHFAGPNNPRWKGGITPEHLMVRWSKKSKDFRNEIFKRDKYTCKKCGRSRKVGDRVVLNIHHIKPFAIHKELRFDENNVITLCQECHRKTDTYGRNL